MDVEQQIEAYIAGQPEGRRHDLATVHRLVLEVAPGCRLWFLDGTDAAGKVVSNPSIGYGVRTLRRARGADREVHRVGVSATGTGLSVYVMGLADRTHLRRAYGDRLGAAKVTGYCISFRHLAAVDTAVLADAVRDGMDAPGG